MDNMTVTIKCALFLTLLFQSSKCARKAMEGFVVGGALTNIRKYPHSVHIDAHCHKPWTCGGAILNQRIVLTAAHCLFGCQIKLKHRVEVAAGSEVLFKVPVQRLVIRIIVHQKYVEKTVENDIALALINANIPLGSHMKRVIVVKSFPRNTFYGKVAGWGLTDEETNSFSVHLKHISQKLRSKNTCFKIGDLTPGMFCAGSEDFYEDHPAAGDSGSALVTSNYTAIGLVSFHIATYPALLVYTNVTYYNPWIIKHAKTLFCDSKSQ